jgi:hypothetical protein
MAFGFPEGDDRMTCKELERYDQGELDEAEFERHASRCPACQEALRLDKDVLSLAKASRRHIDAPTLWSRIQESLRNELSAKTPRAIALSIEKDRRHKRFSVRWKPLRLVPAVIILVGVIGLGFYFGLKNQTPTSGLLAQKALAKVEQKEAEYMEAIKELEKQALPQMEDMDLDLVFLYRDRLETIDAQIVKCREALAMNPANAHIRRYLMAALQDKKDTLADVLNVKTEKPKSRRSI